METDNILHKKASTSANGPKQTNMCLGKDGSDDLHGLDGRNGAYVGHNDQYKLIR